MADRAIEGDESRGKGRRAAKAPGRPEGARVKSTVCLTIESHRRLSVHATMMGMDRSELVDQLIREHLRRYVVSDRGGSAPEAQGRPDGQTSREHGSTQTAA